MPDHSVHKAADLGHDERLLVERWLGRSLSNEETSTTNAYLPHAAPSGEERESVRHEIIAQAREIGSRAGDTEADDVDALIDEAFSQIRGQRG
jgi:hypothetical protein